MLKNIALAFFVLTSVALGGLLIREKHQTKVQHVQIDGLQKQTAVQRDEIQATKAATAELEQKRQQVAARAKADRQALREAREAAAATAQSAAAPDLAFVTPTPSTTEAGKKQPANAFKESIAKMMKDPAMKNMMRAAQSSSLKQVYGDLVKQWKLTPEETSTFYDALLDKQSAAMDKGMKMLEKGGDSTASVPTEDVDAKLKETLGDNMYQQYKEYEKTLSGRYTLSRFQQQLAATNTNALTPDQSQGLLLAVNEEKINMPGGFSTGTNGNPFSMDAAKVDQYIKAQDDLNARIDARVEHMLTPEQLKILKEQQQQSSAMQRVSMEMAAKMMGPSPTP